MLNTKVPKAAASKTKPSSITSLSSKGKQQRTFNQAQMQRVLGGRHSPPADDETMLQGANGHSYMEATFNAHSAKDQRTFHEGNSNLQQDSIQPAHSSFQHVSKGGFAPERPPVGRGQNCSKFMEHDIISGTFVATKSNDKIKVYPEEVKERLLSHMPQRKRVSRVPTSQQLLANSFENQVTIKPGDQLNRPEEQIEQIEQISVLDSSFKEEMKGSPRSDGASHRGGIFQAFNEYVN